MVRDYLRARQHEGNGSLCMNIERVLSIDDMQDCLAIRRQVFIEEQGVSQHEEVDGRDPDCYHYLMRDGERAVATARVLPMGNTAKIQRVAVLDPYRSAGLGESLMRFILDELKSDHPFELAILGAQTHAIGFYERLGFEKRGDEFLDAGIPHFEMVLILS